MILQSFSTEQEAKRVYSNNLRALFFTLVNANEFPLMPSIYKVELKLGKAAITVTSSQICKMRSNAIIKKNNEVIFRNVEYFCRFS
jgi:hypothetical protein